MPDTTIEHGIRTKFQSLRPLMNERLRRQWAAAEASALGPGGIATVARNTITAGLRELEGHQESAPPQTIRRSGGGRKKASEGDPGLGPALEALVDPATRGDPQSPLRWTCKSTAKLAEELTPQNHALSPRTLATLLKGAGYRLQANRKTSEGKQHPDRNAQFEHINQEVLKFHRQKQPAISVDTKKKELVGEFGNGGREWQPKKKPQKVRVHDFKDPELGKAIPYGVYDLASNEEWVSVGITNDTLALRWRAFVAGGKKWAGIVSPDRASC